MVEHEPGFSQHPVAQLIDGSQALVMAEEVKTLHGLQYSSLDLATFEWTEAMKHVGSESFEQELINRFGYNTINLKVLTSERAILVANPEKPMWFISRGINGEKVNLDKPAIAWIIEMQEAHKILEKTNMRQSAYILNLEEELAAAQSRNRNWVERNKIFTIMPVTKERTIEKSERKEDKNESA